MSDNQDKEVSYLDMSDEELANVDPSTVGQAVVAEPTEDNEQVPNPEGATEDGNEETNEGQAATETQSEGLLNEKVEDAEDSGSEKAEGKTESNQPQKVTESKADEVKQDEVPDYEALYKKLTAPFKANGREITVKGVEDAVALMQMGANYNKKMAALKPNLKLMKLLENNGLLSEEKLSFLIDLEKKNPEAINKLVKDSGLDPLDLNADKAGEYKPGTYAVDDKELELDAVLDELQATPTYNQTLSIVSNKWDGKSKQVIADSPQLLKVINSHVQSGIYDLISKEVESERMFGRLDGLSDIEAYRQVGDAIQARGGFNHLGNQGQPAPAKPVVVQPKPKNGDSDKLREKKLAAGSTKPVVPSQARQDHNPLALSDEEFSKLVKSEYL